MSRSWQISSFNGALLAAYFIPTWTMVAFRIVVAPVHGLYERPNIAVALFVSDHLQLAAMSTLRAAWLLALGKLVVAAFFAMFLGLLCLPQVRRSGGQYEALGLALGMGGAISFASMIMASQVGETAALRLHATELLMLLGAAIVLLIEGPAKATGERSATDGLTLQQPQLLNNR